MADVARPSRPCIPLASCQRKKTRARCPRHAIPKLRLRLPPIVGATRVPKRGFSRLGSPLRGCPIQRAATWGHPYFDFAKVQL